jgi:hypothetical protein
MFADNTFGSFVSAISQGDDGNVALNKTKGGLRIRDSKPRRFYKSNFKLTI